MLAYPEIENAASKTNHIEADLQLERVTQDNQAADKCKYMTIHWKYSSPQC